MSVVCSYEEEQRGLLTYRVDAHNSQPLGLVGLLARLSKGDGKLAGQGILPGLPRVQLVPESTDLGIAHPDDGILALQRHIHPWLHWGLNKGQRGLVQLLLARAIHRLHKCPHLQAQTSERI